MGKAIEIFEVAFSTPRDSRSEEYKSGVLDVLRFRLHETDSLQCRYEIGTARADAYLAGCDEGHRLASKYIERVAAGDVMEKQSEGNGSSMPCSMDVGRK